MSATDDITAAMSALSTSSGPTQGLASIANRLRTASNVIVMTGAGISVSAGIPDFRTPGTGLYDNLQKYNLPEPTAVFSIEFFKENPKPFYTLAKELYPGQYLPTPTHFFIKLLADKGKLLRCFTQNIDSLETTAGLDPSLVVAAHGNFDSAHCIATGAEVSPDEVREAVFAGEPGWTAMNQKHGGLVKPDIVFFGENLPKRFFELAKADFPECDLLIVMGTSLAVQPFASLIDSVDSTVPRLLINREKAGEARAMPAEALEQLAVIDAMVADGTLAAEMAVAFGGKIRAAFSSTGFDFDGSRDVAELGDCDTGVVRLAEMLGWGDELDALVADGRRTFDAAVAAAAPETEDSFPTAGDASSPVRDSGLAPLAIATHVSGLWTGASDHGPITWAMALLGSPGAVTAFGCECTVADGVDRYSLITGSWKPTPTGQRVSLNVTPEPDAEGVASAEDAVTYTGYLVTDTDGRPLLSGSCESGSGSGKFHARLEPQTDADQSGLWIGQVKPDPCFIDVAVNPAKWVLVRQRQPRDGGPNVFGAGYFDDAGDIPGAPVLFYTLRGNRDNFDFEKVYCSPVPRALTVEYTAVCLTESAADGQPVLSGGWTNALEATAGMFAARLEEECADVTSAPNRALSVIGEADGSDDDEDDEDKSSPEASAAMPPPTTATPIDAGLKPTVLCFGDSLTEGYHNCGTSFSPYGPALAEALLAGPDKHDVECVVGGFSGLTAKNMVDGELLFDFVGDALQRQPRIAIIMAGTNDLGYGVAPAKIIESLKSLHELCHAAGVRTVAVSIPPSAHTGEGGQLAGCWAETNALLEAWVATAGLAARAADRDGTVAMVTHLQFPFPFEQSQRDREPKEGDRWEPDGLHMSAAGYAAFGAAVAPFLAPLLRTGATA